MTATGVDLTTHIEPMEPDSARRRNLGCPMSPNAMAHQARSDRVAWAGRPTPHAASQLVDVAGGTPRPCCLVAGGWARFIRVAVAQPSRAGSARAPVAGWCWRLAGYRMAGSATHATEHDCVHRAPRGASSGQRRTPVLSWLLAGHTVPAPAASHRTVGLAHQVRQTSGAAIFCTSWCGPNLGLWGLRGQALR